MNATLLNVVRYEHINICFSLWYFCLLTKYILEAIIEC